MSDDKKEEKKDDKKGEKGEKVETAGAAKKGGMGMIAGVVVLLAVGGGLAYVAHGALFPPPAEAKDGKKKGGGHGDGHGEAGAEGEGHESLLHAAAELNLGELMTNISDQGGRRYVKLSCILWVPNQHKTLLGVGGGGDGHGGAAAGPTQLIQLVKSALEEHLRSYALDELTGRNASQQLKKGFSDVATKRLRELYPELPEDARLVREVVITGLLVQ